MCLRIKRSSQFSKNSLYRCGNDVDRNVKQIFFFCCCFLFVQSNYCVIFLCFICQYFFMAGKFIASLRPRPNWSVFKRKRTELFCSVFVHTYRFRIVFARSAAHYNAVSVLKTLLYSQCACSNELDACAFQYIGPRIDSLLVSAHHFGY